ncbi:MAG: hypothetical protein NTV44_04540 [Firmicutes bacterium]|nr:hypothetical protein [Bacillota bacterium]
MKQTRMVAFFSILAFLLAGCHTGVSSSSSSSVDLGANPLPEPSSHVSSLQDICDYVDYGIFNHFDHVDVVLDGYTISDLDLELGKIYWTAQLVDINPEISGELHGNNLTVSFAYRDIDHLISAADEPYYVHATDAAYVVPTVTRDEDFEAFPYTQLTTVVDVETSEELWYVLDQGYLPLPKAGSPAEGMLEKGKTILRSIISDSMTEMEKTRAIYDWMALNISYDYEVIPLGYDDAHAALYDAFYLDGAINNYRAVCDGMSKLFVMLTRMEGLVCHRILGPRIAEFDRPVIGSTGHAWNIINIDGVWYTIDPTGSNLLVDETAPAIVYHRFFLTSESDHDWNYANGVASYCYDDIERITDYDYYANTFFTLDETTHDLVIDSGEELNDFVRYAYSLTYDHLSVDVIINFSYGARLMDEIETAFAAADWEVPSNIYLNEDHLLMVVR